MTPDADQAAGSSQAGEHARGGLPELLGLLDLEGIDTDLVVWIHNEVRLDDWLLFAKATPAAGPVRGLGLGSIFHRDGTLVATVAQEGIAHTSQPRP